MKLKVSFISKILLKDFLKDVSFLVSVISIVLIFCESFCSRVIVGIFTIVALIIQYIYKWKKANKLQKITIDINASTVDIYVGNIFEEEGFKIIAFNEYFDTQVDEHVISSNTLNGEYIKNYVMNIKVLNQDIKKKLKDKVININTSRKTGKKIIYKLGTVFKHNKFFLVAFSHFDKYNKANLSMCDYMDCLLEMWNEIDRYYNGETVVLPLLGGGITRFKEQALSEQELLEILLWSFKLSRVKFKYPSKLKIILHKNIIDKINLYKIKNEFN